MACLITPSTHLPPEASERKASASSFENTNYTNGVEDAKGSSIRGSLVCKYRSAFKTNELTY